MIHNSINGIINRLMVNKSQMQLKAAKCGLENKFVSIKPINHSRKIHFQVAKNNKYLNSQTVIQLAKTVKLLEKILDFRTCLNEKQFTELQMYYTEIG